jgi:hypothetical protein
MKTIKVISLVMLALLLALGVYGIQQALAIEPGLYEVAGNPSCGSLYQATVISGPMGHTGLTDLGPLFGFKIDGWDAVNYPTAGYDNYLEFTLEDGTQHGFATVVTNGPQDPYNTVSIRSLDGISFDWLASLGIDAVIVKGGPNSNAYIYIPAVYGDDGLTTPAGLEISHVEFCYNYELTAEKTANAEYTRTYTWDITKESDGEYWKFIGDPATTHDYLVSVAQFTSDSDFQVTGQIIVTNPTPFTVDFAIEDVVNGVEADVICPEYTLAAGGSVTCTYIAGLGDTLPDNGTNTAVITSSNEDVEGATATADYAFGEPTTVVGFAEINVEDTNGEAWTAAGDDFWQYDREFICSADPADYVDGFYTFTHVNTATITETGQSDEATVVVNCYAPVLSKDADASYDKIHTWEIEKSVDPASQSGFAGDTLVWLWTVNVSEDYEEANFSVTGDIYVTNPADSPGNMTVSLIDQLNDGTLATVDCGGGATSITVAPGANGTCAYTASPAGRTATFNTATGTFNDIAFTATYPVSFVVDVINGTATVVDDQIGLNEELTAGEGPWEFDGPGSHTCSSEQADYGADGTYSDSEYNLASVTGSDGQFASDDATTAYACYAPVLSKDADASYDKIHTWEIEKSVDPASQSGFAGDTLVWLWTVNVSEDYEEANFSVTGDIYVTNPADSPGNMTVSLIDQLNDGTLATVDCGGGATSITVAPGANGTCAYTASPAGRTATFNTATGTFNGIEFSAEATVDFVENVVNGTATVTDDQIDLNQDLTAGEGPWEFPGSDSHTCSSYKSDYGADGTYSATLDNWAYVYSDGEEQDSAFASTTYTCEAGFMDLLKLTDGVVNPGKIWNFALYYGPDGFGSDPIGTGTTLDNQDGVLDFGGPALRPDTTYTVCELEVPAGWSSLWQVDINGDGINDAIVTPYNPDANNTPAEDNGNRCVDFGAGTHIPVTVGTTIRFEVDNTYPGGAPRTPGYWKNWNRCTGGAQQYTADANGGWQEGYWLLEDVLDPTIGGGIVWNGFEIASCELAVSILDQRDFNNGRKMASDAAYTLAMHLLAAQLNFGAGACTTQDVLVTAAAAQDLLVSLGFDATGNYLRPRHQDYNYALALAHYLDQYNNGAFCGNGE